MEGEQLESKILELEHKIELLEANKKSLEQTASDLLSHNVSLRAGAILLEGTLFKERQAKKE